MFVLVLIFPEKPKILKLFRALSPESAESEVSLAPSALLNPLRSAGAQRAHIFAGD